MQRDDRIPNRKATGDSESSVIRSVLSKMTEIEFKNKIECVIKYVCIRMKRKDRSSRFFYCQGYEAAAWLVLRALADMQYAITMTGRKTPCTIKAASLPSGVKKPAAMP